jgi:spore maturation protein CgeB
MASGMRVLIVGAFGPGALEESYASAFRALGCSVEAFDIQQAVARHVRVGGLGTVAHRFLGVEPWIVKANRELVLCAQTYNPDLMLVVGQQPVRAGALAQIRIQHAVRPVLVWPDTLVNLSVHVVQCLPLYDLVATYSRASVEWLERLGCARVRWIPLAGDPSMHAARGSDRGAPFDVDVGFIGQWRPEREDVMARLLAALPEKHIRIWGPDWGRRCRGKRELLKAWAGRPLYREEFARAVATTRVNLNIIDPTNFPAANMRFFEVPLAGGLQVSSACPEMDNVFREGETVVYYTSPDDVVEIVRTVLGDDKRSRDIGEAGRVLVLEEHTYVHRATDIMTQLSVGVVG